MVGEVELFDDDGLALWSGFRTGGYAGLCSALRYGKSGGLLVKRLRLRFGFLVVVDLASHSHSAFADPFSCLGGLVRNALHVQYLVPRIVRNNKAVNCE